MLQKLQLRQSSLVVIFSHSAGQLPPWNKVDRWVPSYTFGLRHSKGSDGRNFWTNDTPWKINMEPTNQPFRKANDLPSLHGIMFQPLIFQGVCNFLLHPTDSQTKKHWGNQINKGANPVLSSLQLAKQLLRHMQPWSFFFVCFSPSVLWVLTLPKLWVRTVRYALSLYAYNLQSIIVYSDYPKYT